MAKEESKDAKKEKRPSLYDHPTSKKHREQGKGGKEHTPKAEKAPAPVKEGHTKQAEPKAEEKPEHPHHAIHHRHHEERHAMHQSHETERRDLHGNHREEHRKMHERHQKAHKDMHARHLEEMQQMAAGPGAEVPGGTPAGPGAPGPTDAAAQAMAAAPPAKG